MAGLELSSASFYCMFFFIYLSASCLRSKYSLARAELDPPPPGPFMNRSISLRRMILASCGS